jgi:hypothetical protein
MLTFGNLTLGTHHFGPRRKRSLTSSKNAENLMAATALHEVVAVTLNRDAQQAMCPMADQFSAAPLESAFLIGAFKRLPRREGTPACRSPATQSDGGAAVGSSGLIWRILRERGLGLAETQAGERTFRMWCGCQN